MTGIDLHAIARVGILLIVLYGAGALLSFLQHYLMAGFNQRLSRRMRKDIAEKINRLKLSYFNFTNTATCFRASRTTWTPCHRRCPTRLRPS